MAENFFSNVVIKDRIKYGTCEYHGTWGNQLALVALHSSSIHSVVSPIRRMSVSGPIYICNNCKKFLAFREINIFTEEILMKIEDYLENPHQILIAKTFMNLKDSFECIKEVFIVPSQHVKIEYKDSLNIAIELGSFAALSYTSWSLTQGKSVMHLWNSDGKRNKFWSSRITRLIIALGRMSLDSDDLNIWIRSYGRLFHIKHFVCAPQAEKMFKFIPGKLIRLEN